MLNRQKIHELDTKRRTRNKRKDRCTAKEIEGKIAKVVEEEWREELEKKNSLGIYRRFIKEMKEEGYSGNLESMLWSRARINSLILGENSRQRNREICVGYVVSVVVRFRRR